MAGPEGKLIKRPPLGGPWAARPELERVGDEQGRPCAVTKFGKGPRRHPLSFAESRTTLAKPSIPRPCRVSPRAVSAPNTAEPLGLSQARLMAA